MTVDVPKLSKTLNDETRIRILKILKQKRQMRYGDLLADLEITNTGRLNYHLKILGDLVTKDGSSGAYSLSEKGSAAIDFLNKFQTLTSGITTPLTVSPITYESTPRFLRALVSLEGVAILLIGLYSYVTLPAQVALHYSLDGQLYTSAPKEIFLALAALLNIPQAVFLLISRVRYSLVNKYPYTIKLSSVRHKPFEDGLRAKRILNKQTIRSYTRLRINCWINHDLHHS